MLATMDCPRLASPRALVTRHLRQIAPLSSCHVDHLAAHLPAIGSTANTVINTGYRQTAVSTGRDMQKTALTRADSRTTSCKSRPQPAPDTPRSRQTESTNMPYTATSRKPRPRTVPGHPDFWEAVAIMGEVRAAKYTYCEVITEGHYLPTCLRHSLDFAAVQDRKRPSPAGGNGL